MRVYHFTLSLFFALSACALAHAFSARPSDVPKSPPGAAGVWLGRPDGSKSCEPGSGLQLQQVLAHMREAGVEVLEAAEGQDGKRRAQMCGLPTGRWLGVRVPEGQVAQAEATGWKRWPDGALRTCLMSCAQ